MKSRALMAETHPAEYLIHKYWARKPSNILREYISEHFDDSATLVDPFCGSGVFLAEAKKQGITAYGFDVNPAAHLLSTVTTNPPELNRYENEAQKLITLAETFTDLYKINEKDVRYFVHRMDSECSNCGKSHSVEDSHKKGSGYYCPDCDSRLYFNFEKSIGTTITKIFDTENNVYEGSKFTKDQDKVLSQIPPISANYTLVTNRRILAFPDMKLSDLFTPRAYYVMSTLFEHAHKIKDEAVKNAILVLLTSSVAQCSRLIPYRNNLKTGGPAWTIPGFWIAPLHLETNPIIHLRARNKKMLKGLAELNNAYKKTKAVVEVRNESAQKGLEKFKDGSIDGLFFDPPYGDNVPYVEFSAVWNGFLNKDISYEEEVIVSDRKEHVSSWDKYEQDISKVIKLFGKKLAKEGKIIMTFNNLDPRAWKIVLESFARESLICTDAKYQVPAVVSSKSQTAANTSYVGDYYCVFQKGSNKKMVEKKVFHLTEVAKKVLVSRGGQAPKNLIHRALILSILNNQTDIGLLERFDEILKPICTEDKNYYYLRDELLDECEPQYALETIVTYAAEKSLGKGKLAIKDFYEIILEETSEVGSPLLGEVKKMLEGRVFFDKNFAYLQRSTESLF